MTTIEPFCSLAHTEDVKIRTCGVETLQIEVDFYTGLERQNDPHHLNRLFFH